MPTNSFSDIRSYLKIGASMYKNNYISVLLLMGGSGSRFKSIVPKQFYKILNKPLYTHTLDFFLNQDYIDEIVLVCHKDWVNIVTKEVNHLDKRIKIVKGGETRQESSFLGLLYCSYQDIVAIHDVARLFVTKDILIKNLDKAITYQAVNTCITANDTIIHSTCGNKISFIPKRSECFCGQTPQTFSYHLIKKAHEYALNNNINNMTDDCSVVMKYGHAVHIVEGNASNIKITTNVDMNVAEQILLKR
jgi:2-C-methyl-D-erythritol 4-phosphate cytidylyltransferase